MRNPFGVPARYLGALSDPPGPTLITSDSVLLWGAPGVGKTYEAVKHARSIVGSAEIMQDGEADKATDERYFRFVFVDMNLLIAHLRTMEFKGKKELMGPIIWAEVLLLDDIGHDVRTDFAVDVITQIVYSRYNDCATTILTTNYSESGLADQLGSPVVSRLIEMCQWVEMTGRDRREGLAGSHRRSSAATT